MRPLGKALLIGLLVTAVLSPPAIAGPRSAPTASPWLSPDAGWQPDLWQAVFWFLRSRFTGGGTKCGSQLDPVGCVPPIPPPPPSQTPPPPVTPESGSQLDPIG